MSVETAAPARTRERIHPAPISPRRSSPGLTHVPSLSEGASLLAASFAGSEGGGEAGGWEAEPATMPTLPLQVSGSSAGPPPRPRAGGGVHWVSRQAATVRGPLLDLQRLAGNAAVAAALGRDADRSSGVAMASAEGGAIDGAGMPGEDDAIGTADATDATDAPDAAGAVPELPAGAGVSGGEPAGGEIDAAGAAGEQDAVREARVADEDVAASDRRAPTDVALQRLEIPGLGNVDISGLISRALSILGPAEQTRDRARGDARKQADDAATASDTEADSGSHDLEAGKHEAERAGEAGSSETQTSANAAAETEQHRTEAGKTHGDHVADEVKGLGPSVEGMVDPLAHETGSAEADAGHRAVGEAGEHAAGTAGPTGELAPPGAEPAISHGPGPPAPGPGPPPPAAPHGAGAPAPEIEHVPATAGPGADHGAPTAAPHGAGAPAPEIEHVLAPGSGAQGPSAPEAPGSGPAVPGPAGGPAGPAGPRAPPTPDHRVAPPTCELVEAAKTVKGWTDKIKKLAGGLITGIGDIRILGTTVRDLAKKARALATGVKERVVAIKDVAVGAARGLATDVKRGIDTTLTRAKKGFDNVVTGVKSGINETKDRVVRGWDTAKTRAGNTIRAAKEGAARLVRRAMAPLRAFLDRHSGVASWLGSVVGRIRRLIGDDPLGDAEAYLASKLHTAQERLRRAKDLAIKVAVAVADAAVRDTARRFQTAKATARVVLDGAKRAAPYVAAAVAPNVLMVAGLAKKAADRWGGDLRAGAQRVERAIKGEACEAIGETVGPCIDMYLPKPDNNVKGFARLTGQADITVPLQEVDVPCNVKMGRGATVAVERSSTAYNVSVDGQASIYANLAFGEQGAKEDVKIESPMGGMGTVWQHLTGVAPAGGTGTGAGTGTPGTAPSTPSTGGTAPAGGAPTGGAPAAATPTTTAPAAGPSATSGPAGTPAPGGGTPGGRPGAPAQSSGSGADVSAEFDAGLKGSASLKFSFPTTGGTTCGGAGGVASLLGALGVAASLPAPLDALAQAGVVGSWEGNLVSNTVTVGLAGSGQISLSKSGLGSLKGQGQAEVYVTAGVERPSQWGAATPPPPAHIVSDDDRNDLNRNGPYARPAGPTDPNALRPVLKIGAAVQGQAAGELVVPRVVVAKGAVTGAGKVEALLLYDRPSDRIILQAVTAQAELGLSAGGINPAVVASQLGPPFGPMAAAKITSLGLAHSNGSIKVTVTGTANNLQKYIDTVAGYLGGDVSTISAGGLSRAVLGVYDSSDFSASVSVIATLSDRAGIGVTAEEIGDKGMKAGVSATGSLEIGKQYQLYP
jgi:hypothetical protein